MKTKFSCTRFLLHWPIRKLVNWGQAYLSKALLVTCEVAMEYMLALTYSPQVWVPRFSTANLKCEPQHCCNSVCHVKWVMDIPEAALKYGLSLQTLSQ